MIIPRKLKSVVGSSSILFILVSIVELPFVECETS